MDKENTQSIFDGFLLFLAIVLANLRALMFIYLYPDTSILLGPAWIEIFFWIIVFIAVVLILKKNNLAADYLLAWRKTWLLGIFILLTLISVFWSIGFIVTLFRTLEFLFATLIAAYVGIRYRSSQLMDILFWFGAILIILSVAIVYAAPQTGVMYWAPFNGAWRGVYWHRNHLSSIMALVNVVLLCRLVIAFESRNKDGILDGVFYLLSLVVLYFTKSATGYILFIVLYFSVFCYWLWLQLAHRLQKRHYYFIFGFCFLGMVLILSNLDFVFGLFHRTTTLTGRTGLWSYLLNAIVPQRLWWGHGFGAVWNFNSFREDVRLHIGWASQPLIADNGFLDILLHVGVIGLTIFVGVFVTAFYRAAAHAITRKALTDFLPLLVMIYALFANISFSLFAETEVFVWFMIVVVLFMTIPGMRLKIEP